MSSSDRGKFSFKLDESEIKIGRDPSCDIILSGIGISRFHASVKLASSGPRLKDLQSTFGIRINNSNIIETAINNGDSLSIGVYLFVITVDTSQLLVRFDLQSDNTSTLLKQTQISGLQKIGRDQENQICLAHPLVSRFHALLMDDGNGSIKIIDKHSTNGTYVNGVPVTEKKLADGDTIQIGPYRLFVDGTKIISSGLQNQVRIDAESVSIREKKLSILQNISLSILPGEFITVVGPSGAGKSTLVKILSGRLRPSCGTVLINGYPLTQMFRAMSQMIGYVSQGNVLYKELTVTEIFREQSKIRLPFDSTCEEREARVNDVLTLLELEKVKNTLIGKLSGGEAKRVHLGIELVSSPSIIFLDEPLAGLDPGLVRKFMQLFRRICDRGHTLILTTHTLEQIDLCDRIIFLNNGKILFNGSSAEIATKFGLKTIADLFEKLNTIDESQYQNIISKSQAIQPPYGSVKKVRNLFFAQTGLLFIRYNKIFIRDRKSAFLSFIQTPLIAALLGIVFENGSTFFPMSFYFCICISTIWIGGVSTIREFAKDWNCIGREINGNLSINSLIISKLLVAVEISLVQSFLFVITLSMVFVHSSFSLQFILLCCCGMMAGSILGLSISACAAHVGRAIAVLPVLFIPQIFFSGILVPFDSMGAFGDIISRLTISRPLFSMFKEVCLLEHPILYQNEWLPLFSLVSGFIILIFIAVYTRCRRL